MRLLCLCVLLSLQMACAVSRIESLRAQSFHCCPKHVLVCPVLQGRGPADVVRNVFKGACVGEQDCQTCAVLWAEMLRPNKPDFGAVGAFPVLCYVRRCCLDVPEKFAVQVGDYQRKTQSPMVWFALRKTALPRSATQSFTEEAKQRLGRLISR